MQVWTPVFHHQFLDGNPANFSAPPGALTALPNGLAVQPTPPPEQRGYAIAPGHSLSYALERTLLGVIGIDIRLDVIVFGSAQDPVDVQVRLDGQAVRVIADFIGPLLRLQFRVGGTTMAASIPLDAESGLFRLHLRWHTHGQGSMWVNDVLRAYQPALQPGLSLPITTIFVGHHSLSVTPAPPRMRVRRFTVKVLRKDDATRLLDDLFPLPRPLPIDPDCAKQVEGLTGAAMVEARQLMATAVTTWTRRWTAGQAHSPFSAEAVAAHEAAVQAGRAFVAFMLGQERADADRFVAQASTFLALLQAVDPARYATLLAKAEEASTRVDLPCITALEPLRRLYESRLTPLSELVRDLAVAAHAVGGPHA
ncbi:hypothetical protein [Luteitalea sp.]|uniref:hypothetical protein n=1 Tax=Luteitalea sp. TaxID=2004800 RepID=UPI0025C01E4C|nr:hypothetical protein [Luteitalea sp.]